MQNLMNKRSTRQRMATAMALLTGGVVLVVAFVINVLMFTNRYRWENRSLQEQQPRQILWKRLAQNIVVESLKRQDLLKDGFLWGNLTRVGDKWFLAQDVQGQYTARHVTSMVERQVKLIWWSVVILLLASLIAFGLAWALTKRLMKDIESLTDFVESRDISNLHDTIQLVHLPETDTIARLADSVSATNHQLLQQIEKIKQFALYAAHELKSPLMSMQGSLDLALKTQNYLKYMDRLGTTVDTMQWSVNTLLMTVDSDRADQDAELIVVKHLIDTQINQLSEQYGEQKVVLLWPRATTVTQPRGALTTLLKNLLSNAWKYHQGGSAIRIDWTSDAISITNANHDLRQEDLTSLWMPFWQLQTGSMDGQGLGLAVVHSVCEAMGWSVDIVKDGDEVVTNIQITESK